MVTKEEYTPNQGDIIQLDYDSNTRGHEQKGRPGLVISDQKLNSFTGLCYVCPITNNMKCYPFQVTLSKRHKTTGVIMCEQMRPYDFKERKIKYIEKIKEKDLEEVLEILRWTFF